MACAGSVEGLHADSADHKQYYVRYVTAAEQVVTEWFDAEDLVGN